VHEHDSADTHAMLFELVRSVSLLHVLDGGAAGPASMSELFALHELDSTPGLAQNELADRLRLDKSTVSRLVAGLESRGLVTRERDTGNRRFVRLSITPAGRRLHQRVGRGLHKRQQEVLEAMTAEERSALDVGLAGLLRALHSTVNPDG
jgi:DNA-binding MarR family transcriptional regulator